jgi:hypothetical protein
MLQVSHTNSQDQGPNVTKVYNTNSHEQGPTDTKVYHTNSQEQGSNVTNVYHTNSRYGGLIRDEVVVILYHVNCIILNSNGFRGDQNVKCYQERWTTSDDNTSHDPFC